MLRDDALRHRQAQTRPARIQTFGDEGIENIRQNVRRNAMPVILDPNHDRRLPLAQLPPRPHLDPPRRAPAGLRRIQRVPQQVHEHLKQTVGVPRHPMLRPHLI